MANLSFSAVPTNPGMGFKTNTQTTTPKTQVSNATDITSRPVGLNQATSSAVNSGIMGGQAKNPNTNLVSPTNTKNTLPFSQLQPAPKSQPDSTQPSTPQTPSQNPGIFSNVAQNLASVSAGNSAGTVNNATNGLMSQASGENPAAPNTNRLTDISNNQSPAVTQAQDDYNKFTQTAPYLLSEEKTGATSDIASGRAGLLSNVLAERQQGLAQNVQNALTGQGQQIGAAEGAGSQALTSQGQKITAGTSAGNLGVSQQQTQNQASNTLLGTPGGALSTYGLMGQGANGGNLNPQDNASSLAQQVISGKMSYQDAVSSLGYTGSAGQQMLNQAIQTASPGFNTQQAQANSQVQGQLAPQGNLASAELNNLQQTLSSMNGLQNTSIPLVNQFTRWIGSLTGNSSSQQLKDAQSAATSAVKTALGTAYGGTPTSFDSLVNAWFPEGATPNQVQAGIQQFNALMKARQSSFNSPGTTQFTPAGNSGTGTTSTSSNNAGSNTYGFSSFLGS